MALKSCVSMSHLMSPFLSCIPDYHKVTYSLCVKVTLIMHCNNITAPSTVIYDNACNLHNYVLNRAPYFFKDTWFLIDRFHWRNHTGEATHHCT